MSERHEEASSAMPDVTVRPARQEDLNVPVRLMAGVQSLHAQALPGVFRRELDENAARAVFANALHEDRVFLAERMRLPVGYLWLAIVERAADAAMPERRFAYINHIGVVPEARRLGGGRALMEAARAEARATGVAEIGVDWWHFNVPAAAFFARLGFEPRRHVAFAHL
jgi:ribosomal protein S18 acetylase RimI-like enzyme